LTPDATTPARRRVLVGYTSYPESDRNAGALRLFEIVRLLVESGNQVCFLAVRDNGPAYRRPLEKLGVECHADDDEGLSASAATMAIFLKHGQFDIAVFSHHFVYSRYASSLRALLPRCRCIVDTVDLHSLRREREAALGLATRAEVDRERAAEQRSIQDADQVWVVTERERGILTDLGWARAEQVEVVPTVHQLLQHPPGFSQRHGIVFLGSYQHRPNVDAARFFVEEILPIARVQLPDVNVLIAGSDPPEAIRDLAGADSHVQVTGFVEDHRALLAGCRVAIAPLRYGAGMKGKIGEYLSCGLPCVTTSIGAEGMELRHGNEVLIADDAEGFAAQIASLYSDAELWERLAGAGREYIQARYTPAAIRPRLEQALHAVDEVRRQPERGTAGKIWRLLSSPAAFSRNVRRAWRSFFRGGLGEVRARYALWINR
jgi:glycosyltransferase involved in cell wall biosynthesis